MTEINRYELTPNDSHKSFYRKAWCIEYADGSSALLSYETIALIRDKSGKLHRTWDAWSATTGRHIAAFAGLNKAAYLAMPYEATAIAA